MTFDQSIALCIRLKMILSFHQMNTGLFGKDCRHALSKFRVRIDAGSHGGASCWQLAYGMDRLRRSEG